MQEKNNKSFQAGFTIFEVLAIVVIIGIMAGLGYSDFDAMRNQLALKRAAYQVGQDLRRAQEMALSGATATGGIPHGYGIYIDTTKTSDGEESQETDYYKLYADTSNPLAQPLDSGWGYYDSGDPVYQSIIVKGGPVIKKFENYDGTIPDPNPKKISVEFVPPNPDTKIFDVTGNASSRPSLQIVLGFPADSGITQTKCVGINQAGLITINDITINGSCGSLSN